MPRGWKVRTPLNPLERSVPLDATRASFHLSADAGGLATPFLINSFSPANDRRGGDVMEGHPGPGRAVVGRRAAADTGSADRTPHAAFPPLCRVLS